MLTRSGLVRAIVFLDRDGVLNERKVGGYVDNAADLKPTDAIIPVLARCASVDGLALVVVTNQGCISRELASKGSVLALNRQLFRWLSARGVFIEACYVCPHHPLAVKAQNRKCECRKPKPGLLTMGLKEFGVSPDMALILGDQQSDMMAGMQAGLSEDTCVMVDVADHGSVSKAILVVDEWRRGICA